MLANAINEPILDFCVIKTTAYQSPLKCIKIQKNTYEQPSKGHDEEIFFEATFAFPPNTCT